MSRIGDPATIGSMPNQQFQCEHTEASRAFLERCSKYFVDSPDLAPVRDAHPDHWQSLETMATYSFLGTKIYAIPDFTYIDGETVHIWDWKTGKPRDADLFQLHTYALYACEKWSTDPEQIVLHAAYIGEGHVQTTPVDSNRLSANHPRSGHSRALTLQKSNVPTFLVLLNDQGSLLGVVRVTCALAGTH